MSEEFNPEEALKPAVVPQEQAQIQTQEPQKMIIPKRMVRKKFVRTITLRESLDEGMHREVQIPATLRDAKLQQVVLVSKLQKTQEATLDQIIDEKKILSHSEMQGLNAAVKTSGEMMMKLYGGAPSEVSEGANDSATLGTALGVGISAGLSVLASVDPDLSTALVAVTKSAKKAMKPEPIDVTATGTQ